VVADAEVGDLSSALRLAVLLDVHLDAIELLEQALIHRSWAFEHGGVAHNERLEFLGDAVLALVVTDEIFQAHPTDPEGRLAKLRAAAVRTGTLAAVARDLGLGAFVRLGRGEDASGGRDKDSILADTLEAVFGAVYLDQGFATAYDLIQRLFAGRLVGLAAHTESLDYKTSLQELTALRFRVLPRYELSDVGPDHDKKFTATVSVRGEVVGQGDGRNKKQAEQRAARQAFQRLIEVPEPPATPAGRR